MFDSICASCAAAGDVPIAPDAPGPPAAAPVACGLRRRAGLLIERHFPLLALRVVERRRAPATKLGEGLAQRWATASERRIRRQRQIDTEDADVVRRLFLVAEITLRRLHREALRFGTESIEDERRHDRTRVGCGRRWRRGRRGGRRSDSGCLRRRLFEERRERSELLRNAVFDDLEVRLRQIADGLALLVANDDVDEDGAHGFANRARLRGRLLLAGSRRCRNQDGDCDGKRHAKTCHRPPTDCAPVRCVRAACPAS